MTKRLPKLVLLGIATLLLSSLGHAQTYLGTLSGANENPATGSAGTGGTIVTLDTVAHTLRVTVNFSGLGSGVTASHIHCCTAPPGNIGVATTTPTFAGFPSGVTFGAYDATFNTLLASTWNAAFITANGGTPASAEAALAAGLAAGLAYLNIHTTNFGGGEIRGFLVLQPPTALNVPTLSARSLALAAGVLALLGILALRRRR